MEKKEDLERKLISKEHYLDLAKEQIQSWAPEIGGTGGTPNIDQFLSKVGSFTLNPLCEDDMESVDATIALVKEASDDLERCWLDVNERGSCEHQLNAILDAVEELRTSYKDLMKCQIQTEFQLEKEKRKKGSI